MWSKMQQQMTSKVLSIFTLDLFLPLLVLPHFGNLKNICLTHTTNQTLVTSMLKVFQPNQFVTEVNAFEIREWVQESLNTGASNLLIDFQDVTFINSSGLGALAIALKMVREAGCRLALCSLSAQARMTLEISGMDKAFEIYSTSDDFKRMALGAQPQTA